MSNKKKYSPEGREFKDSVVQELREDTAFREEYLKDLLREQELPMIAIGLRDLVEALGGVGVVSKGTGLNRQNLYKALSGNVRPDFPTIMKIINYAGYNLSVDKQKKAPNHFRTSALAHQ
jgi:probable addiction module antidote protein